MLVSGLGCETLTLIKTGRSEGKEPKDIHLDLFYFLTVAHIFCAVVYNSSSFYCLCSLLRQTLILLRLWSIVTNMVKPQHL